MSTDLHLHLHLHHHLPKLRISAAVKPDNDQEDDVVTPSSDDQTSNDRIMSSAITRNDETETENKNKNDDAAAAVAVAAVVSDAENDESYKTPTSKESKIPENLTCPPAPRKPKPFVSCKRKLLDEFQFFEVTSNEDMDAFFRSTFPKRTCPCT